MKNPKMKNLASPIISKCCELVIQKFGATATTEIGNKFGENLMKNLASPLRFQIS